jgi:hypothetical protein
MNTHELAQILLPAFEARLAASGGIRLAAPFLCYMADDLLATPGGYGGDAVAAAIKTLFPFGEKRVTPSLELCVTDAIRQGRLDDDAAHLTRGWGSRGLLTLSTGCSRADGYEKRATIRREFLQALLQRPPVELGNYVAS